MPKLIKWLQGIYQNPTQFDVVDVSGNTKSITNNFGTVIQEGTPLSAENMNVLQEGMVYSLTDIGTTNTIEVTLDGFTATDYTSDLKIAVIPNATTTGATTISINGLATKDVKKENNVALTGYDIISGQPAFLQYNATAGYFVLANPQNVKRLEGKGQADFATAAQGIKADNALPAVNYTANDVLAKMLTVDTDESGLNSSTLKGQSWEDFVENFNIKVTAGTFDFSAKNLIGRTWHFADGTTSTDEKPTRVLSKAQTVRLTGSFVFSPNCEISDENTNTSYVGDISDLPNLSYYLILDNCSNVTGDLSDLPNLSYYLSLSNCSNVTGDLSDLPNLSNYLSLSNCSNITGDLLDLPNLSSFLRLDNCNNITGDLSDLPNLSYYLNLDNCNNITGDLSDLPNLSHYLILDNCSNVTGDLSDLPNLSSFLRLDNCNNITGVLNSTVTATTIILSNTGLSISDVDNTIANIVTANKSNGTLNLSGLQRSSASNANIATLQSRGWTITDATVV